jgi:Holliday junction resolvase
MGIHRMAARRDNNEAEIVSALEKCGCSVWRLSGKGLTDLLVGRAGQNYLLEIKNPDAGGELTDDQVYWHQTWRGRAHIVSTVDEALIVVGAIQRQGY